MKIEIYSDVVCPWCYIGARRLSKALASVPKEDVVDVAFRPFQLDPSAPEKAVPLPEQLERRFGSRVDEILARVTATATGEDIPIAWDKALSVNTRQAHRLLSWAEREFGSEQQRALAERLFQMYFVDGGDIGDIEQLAAAADAVGLDAARAQTYLDSHEGVEALEAEFDNARRLGIRAVPTFVIDGQYAIQGAQSVASFVEALDQVRARARS